MALRSGFFNSIGDDRLYSSVDISEIFNGLFTDGIFESVMMGGSYNKNKCLRVSAYDGMMINIGPGKAWFNNVWAVNDADYPLMLPESDMLLKRYDAIVLEIDKNEFRRKASFVVISGQAADSPKKPAIPNDTNVYRYVLAYILVDAGVEEIVQKKITDNVGTTSTPYAIYLGADPSIIVANNLITTSPGKSLDAVQGKALDDKITQSNNSIAASNSNISTANSNISKANTNVKNALDKLNSTCPFKLGVKNGEYGYYKTDGTTFVPFLGGRIKKLGSGASFNLTSYSNYKNFTANNFFFKITKIDASCGSKTITKANPYKEPGGYYSICTYTEYVSFTGKSFNIQPTFSYDAAKGILTVSNLTKSVNGVLQRKVDQVWSPHDMPPDGRTDIIEDESQNVSIKLTATVDVYLVY